MPPRFQALIILVTVYLLALFVLWTLSWIGPVSVTVQGVIQQGATTVWVAAAGLVAAFVIVAITGLVAVYLLAN